MKDEKVDVKKKEEEDDSKAVAKETHKSTRAQKAATMFLTSELCFTELADNRRSFPTRANNREC